VKEHLTYSNVVSTICLFILLGGVSWAATSLPKNSVGSTCESIGSIPISRGSRIAIRAVYFSGEPASVAFGWTATAP
jgi:hypothetical protein